MTLMPVGLAALAVETLSSVPKFFSNIILADLYS